MEETDAGETEKEGEQRCGAVERASGGNVAEAPDKLSRAHERVIMAVAWLVCAATDGFELSLRSGVRAVSCDSRDPCANAAS